MKYTKGIWQQGFGKKNNGVYSHIDGNRICIAECDFTPYRIAFNLLDEDFPSYLSKDAEVANIKLMAASPKLLKALGESNKILREKIGDLSIIDSNDELLYKLL